MSVNYLTNEKNVSHRFRESLRNHSGPTSVEIKHVAARLLGTGLIAGGGVTTFFSLLGIVTWPVSLLSIPSVLIGVGLIYGLRLQKYENPEQLEQFRREAVRMSLSELIQAYGWRDLLRFEILTPDRFAQKYRAHLQGKGLIEIIDFYEKAVSYVLSSNCRGEYSIPPVSEFAEKWRSETAGLSYQEIIQKYSLDKLEKYGVLSREELNHIKDLKNDYLVFKRYRDEKAEQMEQQFNQETAQAKQDCDAECARAEQLYHNDNGVKQLQAFELNYTRKRQEIQQAQNQSKLEARDVFHRAIAPYTEGGKIVYSQLSAGNKLLFDAELQTLRVAENHIDTAARLQIEKIDQERKTHLTRLHTEEERIRREKIRVIEEAKARYDLAIAQPLQRKTEGLRPIDEAFSSSMLGLNSRYRAYLYLVGVV